MLTSYSFEAKTSPDALNKCLKELNLTPNDIHIKESETEGTIFKAKKVILEVIIKKDVINYIKEYIKTISLSLDIDIKTEIRDIEDVYNVQMISDNNAILIGRDGCTINAIQQLLKQALNVNRGFNIKINVDVSNYKTNKIEKLEQEVKKIIADILTSKIDVTLDPMNSYERKVVHCLVSNYPNLTSESIGEGQNRHIILKYIDE